MVCLWLPAQTTNMQGALRGICTHQKEQLLWILLARVHVTQKKFPSQPLQISPNPSVCVISCFFDVQDPDVWTTCAVRGNPAES